MIEDDKIREALHHWTPRFLVNGVNYNDLQLIIEHMDHWDDWCRVWSEMGERHEALGEEAWRRDRRVSAGQHFSHAAIYYHFGQMIFYTDKAQKMEAHRKKVEVYRRAAPLLAPPAQRLEIPYEDTSLPAYLRLPPGEGPHPLVILVCGLDSVKEQEAHWEDELLARGMAALAFDGPGQGEMWARMKMRRDYETAVSAIIDYLQARPEIDPDRIALLGHSMGGHFGARAAGREPRLAAAVLIAGFFELQPWDEMSVFVRAGLQHIFGASSVEETKQKARELTLEGVAGDIRCPLLVVHGAQDTLIPLSEAQRLVDATTCPTDLLVYEDGNHSCNNIVYQVHADVADWLAEHFG